MELGQKSVTVITPYLNAFLWHSRGHQFNPVHLHHKLTEKDLRKPDRKSFSILDSSLLTHLGVRPIFKAICLPVFVPLMIQTDTFCILANYISS